MYMEESDIHPGTIPQEGKRAYIISLNTCMCVYTYIVYMHATSLRIVSVRNVRYRKTRNFGEWKLTNLANWAKL